MSKCRSKNPGSCRYHGVNFITGKLYNEYTVKQKHKLNQDEIKNLVEQTVLIIDSYDTDPHTPLKSKRDSHNIRKLHEATYFYDKTSIHSKYGLPEAEIFAKIAFYYDKNATKLPAVNLLEPPTKTSSHKKYDYALASYTVNEGTPVSVGDTYYGGWEDYEMLKHTKQCGIAAVESVKEDYWEEFNGTFNEDDETVHGISAKCQCGCGYFKGEIRVQKRVVDIIQNLANNYFD